MNRSFLTSFIFILLLNSVKSQSFHSTSDISWSKTRTLLWSDFIGKVDTKSTSIALSSTSILCKPYFSNDSSMIWVEAIFSSQNSWKKRGDLDSFDLTHEQTHFNITELYVRKLRKIISDEIKSKQKNQEVDLLFKINNSLKILSKECEEMQNLYDKETNHSINSAEQLKWNKLIWDNLEKLSNWTSTSFFIEKIYAYKNAD